METGVTGDVRPQITCYQGARLKEVKILHVYLGGKSGGGLVIRLKPNFDHRLNSVGHLQSSMTSPILSADEVIPSPCCMTIHSRGPKTQGGCSQVFLSELCTDELL